MRIRWVLKTYKAFLMDMTLHKMNWNFLMTPNILVVKINLKYNTKNFMLRSVSCYILWETHYGPETTHYEAMGHETEINLQCHIRVSHTLNSQLLHCQISNVHMKLVTLQRHIRGISCQLNDLSNVQNFHYLIASLKNEAKDLLCNLQFTNENVLFPGI